MSSSADPTRRGFFARALAAVAGCLGASTIQAAPVARRPVLYRSSGTLGVRCPLLTAIDWFDMRPGDLVHAKWPDRMERWEVSGTPYWNTAGESPVEAVPVARSWVWTKIDTVEKWRAAVRAEASDALAADRLIAFAVITPGDHFHYWVPEFPAGG